MEKLGRINTGGGTGCVYPDGNGVQWRVKPDGDGCKAVDTATCRSVDTII